MREARSDVRQQMNPANERIGLIRDRPLHVQSDEGYRRETGVPVQAGKTLGCDETATP